MSRISPCCGPLAFVWNSQESFTIKNFWPHCNSNQLDHFFLSINRPHISISLLELFMVLVSGYVECVKLHYTWKLRLPTSSRGISQYSYHTLQCYITYIPWHSALIFTSSVIIYRRYGFILHKKLYFDAAAQIRVKQTDQKS